MATDRVLDVLAPAVGRWAGVNRLRLMPDDEFAESPATATVATAAGGHAVTLAYTWVHEDDGPQDGVLLLAGEEGGTGVRAVWVDSWHQQPHWMLLTGRVEDGVVRLEGSYDGWGWLIAIDPRAGNPLVGMHNVPPGVAAYPVVELDCTSLVA